MPYHDYALNIVSVVEQLAAILGSPEVALDRRHAPAIFSKFLFTLLERMAKPKVTESNDDSTCCDQARMPAEFQYRMDDCMSSGTVFLDYAQGSSQQARSGTSFALNHFAQAVNSLQGQSSAWSCAYEQLRAPPSEMF